MIRLLLLILILPCWLGAAKKVFDLELPQKKFVKLNVFERAQYKKAYDLVKKKNFKAAVDEFEKFKHQHPDNSQMAYVIFMKAYCLHQAKQRHKAIKTYNEVLDYFGDDILYAGAALYFMAQAHFDNGDNKAALKALKEMAEDEDYQKHALAAGAFRYLADNLLKNKQVHESVKYLKLIVVNFGKENQKETNIALGELCDYFILMKQFSSYEKFVQEVNENQKASQTALSILSRVGHVVRFNDQSKWIKYTEFKSGKNTEIIEKFLTYFRAKKSTFDKNLWSYHSSLLDFLAQYQQKDFPAELKDSEAYIKTIKDSQKVDSYLNGLVSLLLRRNIAKRFDEAIRLTTQMKNSETQQRSYSSIIDTMIRSGQHQSATVLLGRLKDRNTALWKKVSIYSSQKKYNDVVKTMDEIAKNDAEQVLPVKKRKAGLFHHIGKYAEAIKLYREVGTPPSSLWSIADCYVKMKSTKEAISTLTELENAFPDSAPDAALKKTHIYHSIKDKKKAIATARRILKMYPKSKASSQAHQILEEYGISTGGGVIEE